MSPPRPLHALIRLIRVADISEGVVETVLIIENCQLALSPKGISQRSPVPAQAESADTHPATLRCGLLRRVVLVGTVCFSGWLAPIPCSGASQQQEVISTEFARRAIVTAITEEITLDGALEEPAWNRAPKIGDLVQREPRPGENPSEKTDVMLLHDGNFLYIGVICYDSEPHRVIGTQMARDANLNSDDRISIVLDTYRDRRNAFYFSTNPAGALVDGLVFANGQSNNEWDAIWTVRTRRTEQGWSAEFAIPFKSLSFSTGRTVWGFNFSRNIHRKLEEARWSGARLQTGFFQVSEAGEIIMPENLTQGIGLDIRPFIGGRWLHAGTNGNDTVTGKPGLDLFYNFTPSLKLSATVNTDFGETEVDARQINLSRFSLLFPEKRSFFLEDVGVFSFASTGVGRPGGIPATGSEVFPFFSRQIGLLSGKEVPIDFGVKLTGKVGRTDLGVLEVRSRELPTLPAKNFLVGRVKRNILQQSYIGAIFTKGNPALPISSSTVGADIRLATSRFLGGRRNLVFNAYGLRSINEGNSDRDFSYGIAAQYPNDKFRAQVIWREIPENFDPALGFVQRKNVRLLRIGVSYNPRPQDFLGIQQMFHDVFFTRFTRLDKGEVESWDLYATLVDWHFKSGDSMHSVFDVNPTYERLFSSFAISPGVILPPGEYRFTRWHGNFASARKRKLQVSIRGSFGTYWSGHAETLTTGLTYKVPPYFSISFNANQTFARLPEGNFVTRILSSQISYAASPYLSFSNLIQYDNRSRNLGWQSRVRWILQPGNDLFFVFNQGWIQDPKGGYRFSPQDSKMSAKLQYTFRF